MDFNFHLITEASSPRYLQDLSVNVKNVVMMHISYCRPIIKFYNLVYIINPMVGLVDSHPPRAISLQLAWYISVVMCPHKLHTHALGPDVPIKWAYGTIIT